MRRFLVTDETLGADPRVRAWSVDRVRDDQRLLNTHSLRAHDPPWAALHWLTVAAGVEPWFDPGVLVGVFDTEFGWHFDDSRVERAEPPGLKQLSFLHKADECTDDQFVVRYRAHVPEARRHMPGLWRYQQNRTAPVPAYPRALYGISELWFASVDDFCTRYWAHADSHVEEHEEVAQFLSPATWSVLFTEEVRK